MFSQLAIHKCVPLHGMVLNKGFSCQERSACVFVQALNLNDTSLTDKGVTAVAVAIAQSAPHLEELELALNEITPQGTP